MKTRRKKILVVLASSSLALVFASAVGELLLRRHERNRKSVPVPMLSLYYRHSRLHYALRRNADYYGWAHVNAQGFRGRRDVSPDKPAGVTRVLAVGGSTTFETTVSGDERAWPARAEHWLAQLAPERRVEVVNAGVPGYRNIDNLIRLETELHRFEPDVIVLYEVHNDLYEALKTVSDPPDSSDETPDEMPAVTPWGRWLGRHSLLYQKTAHALNVVWTKRARHWRKKERGETPEQLSARIEEALARGASDFGRNLAAFIAVANSYGIHVVVPEASNVSGPGALSEDDPAIRQVWEVNFPYTTPEVVLRGYARYGEAARRAVSCAASATYLPTADFGLRGTRWYAPYDPIHTNDDGAEQMGRKMAEALLSTGALEPRRAGVAPCRQDN